MRGLTCILCLAVALKADVLLADNPIRTSFKVRDTGLTTKASVQGKYRRLLRVIKVPEDKEHYGEFSDYGYYTGSEWRGHSKIPAGHWVYLYPHWYIWGDKVK